MSQHPDPYAGGQPGVSPREERTMGMLGHAIPLVAMVVSAGVLGFVASLVLYFLYRDKGPFVRANVANSLNIQIATGIVLTNPDAAGVPKELDRRYPYDVAASRRLLAEAGYPEGRDAASGKQVGRFQHTGEVLSVAFSPDGKLLAAGGADGTAKVWDAADFLPNRDR